MQRGEEEKTFLQVEHVIEESKTPEKISSIAQRKKLGGFPSCSSSFSLSFSAFFIFLFAEQKLDSQDRKNNQITKQKKAMEMWKKSGGTEGSKVSQVRNLHYPVKKFLQTFFPQIKIRNGE